MEKIDIFQFWHKRDLLGRAVVSKDKTARSDASKLPRFSCTREIENEGSNGGKSSGWRKWVSCFLAVSVPILFPSIQMYLFQQMWGDLKVPLNKTNCSCTCWDAVFKGPYEGGGDATFKHVYFNADVVTLKMWITTVIGVVFYYEAVKRLVSLKLVKKLRGSMGVMLVGSFYSNYYGWWAQWNYWNDEIPTLMPYQAFFTVTELISTITALYNADARHRVKPSHMLIILTIATFHSISSGLDQFISNVLLDRGVYYQKQRDVALMITDFINISVSLFEIWKHTRNNGTTLYEILCRRVHLALMASLMAAMYVTVSLFPRPE